MSNELMDFTPRANFDFFTYRCAPNEERKRSFTTKCEHVLEYAHATVQDMCLLGYNLMELKNGGEWKDVCDPMTGNSFNYLSFEAFCEYAFGFSETRTKNLVGLAQFVQISGTKDGFIEERFKEFSTSALVELSSVPSGQRHYFTSNMSVRDIRLVKEYLNKGDYWSDKQNEDFDVMTYARAYKEAKETKKNVTEQSTNETDVIPGQMTLEDIEEEQDAQASAKSDVGFSSSSFWDIEDDELDEARYDEPTEEREEVEEDEPAETVSCETKPETVQSRYSFHNREAIRAFYGDYRNWEKNYATFTGIEAFEYKFVGTNISIVALETTTCKDIANLKPERTVVRYFWRERRDGMLHAYEVSTLDLETHIKVIKDEL